MRELLLRLGKIIARVGESLQARALVDAGIIPARKPPMRAEPPAEQIQPPGPGNGQPTAAAFRAWRAPSAKEIDRARGDAAAYDMPMVKICRGPMKGCGEGVDQATCQDCFRVHWHDRRKSEEIVAALERGDA